MKKEKFNKNIQFVNRLFDRDTLFLQTYRINFLFVISCYANGILNNNVKKKIREKIRNDYILMLNSSYYFYKVYPLSTTINEFVETNFCFLLGKVFYEDSKPYIWLALEKGNNENIKIIEKLKLISKLETFSFDSQVASEKD